MSTWRIFSDDGNKFRWEVAGGVAQSEAEVHPIPPVSSGSRLPSMADLLLEGCSKLMESANGDEGSTPMFRTGSGKSVVLKQSSISKALSVLGDEGVSGCAFYAGEAINRGGPGCFSNSLFQTASGKSVGVSSTGLLRARSLLGMEGDGDDSSIFDELQYPQRPSTTKENLDWQSLNHTGMRCSPTKDLAMPTCSPALTYKIGFAGTRPMNEFTPDSLQSKVSDPAAKPPPIKFQTAGGRSLSVSSDALERARSLLGDPELGSFFSEGDEKSDPVGTASEDRRTSETSTSKGRETYSGFTYPGAARSKYMPKNFTSPLKASSNQLQSVLNKPKVLFGSNLISQFDAVDDDRACGSNHFVNKENSLLSDRSYINDEARDKSLENGTNSKTDELAKPCRRPLVDISNTTQINSADNRQVCSEKRKLRSVSVSPFKRPRNSKFITPLSKNHCPSGLSVLSAQHTACRRRVSTKYPVQTSRMQIKEYFGVPFPHRGKLEEQARGIRSDNAPYYLFPDHSGTNCIGVEALRHMLTQSGASEQCASEEWVANHYKWIVWKLGCYDRYRPLKLSTKFLTVTNVLEELKYRYEREMNHGHRSALKRILEGDIPPSSMMILCISAVYACSKAETEDYPPVLNDGHQADTTGKVQLTDGWYAVDALLDVSLSKNLSTGKLFVGQKLRIWGAGFSGWVSPVSPLEASKDVSLLLHINGTYRAHWADRLGLCKRNGTPLAFRCIKSNGGSVPHTLVGVTRIYPVLYKEKFTKGGSVVRSERMEAKMIQVFNDRRSVVVEGVVSEFQRGTKSSRPYNDSDSEEGAQLLKILETSAEPELLLAEMSSEQLTTFVSYQAKVQATKQMNMDNAIQKALQDAGLQEREVTPFMRVRVVGLTTSGGGKGLSKEGLITIWNPTEKQQLELVEGQVYAVAGLVPVSSDSNTLYLQARGSGNKWRPLSPSQTQSFEPFFTPRLSTSLSNLGEVALGREFDMVAVVVHVGEVYGTGASSKQWVFVTDNSISTSNLEAANSLLVLSFSAPSIDKDSAAPVNHNLAGSTVGFCNIIKRKKDQTNQLWIAEATENSTYYLNFDSPNCSHLRKTAASIQSWAKISTTVISSLKEKVLNIVDGSKS
ncbi:Protein BREAST CANCER SUSCEPTIBILITY 2 homolog B [Linum perenne]